VTHAEPSKYLVPLQEAQVAELPEQVAQVASQARQLEPERYFAPEHPVQAVELLEQVAHDELHVLQVFEDESA